MSDQTNITRVASEATTRIPATQIAGSTAKAQSKHHFTKYIGWAETPSIYW